MDFCVLGMPGANGWAKAVRREAKEQFNDIKPFTGPIRVQFIFSLPRPANHYRDGDIGKGTRIGVPIWHGKKPDGITLARITVDALTGITWKDNAQIAMLQADKIYNSIEAGVTVLIENLRGNPHK